MQYDKAGHDRSDCWNDNKRAPARKGFWQKPRGGGRRRQRRGVAVGERERERAQATVASKSSLITLLSRRLFQLIATRRELLLSFYTRLQPAFRLLMRPSWYLMPLILVRDRFSRDCELLAEKHCSEQGNGRRHFNETVIIENILNKTKNSRQRAE